MPIGDQLAFFEGKGSGAKQEPEPKRYVGHAEVKEGTTIKLVATVKGDRPGGQTTWVIDDGSKGAPEEKPAEVGTAIPVKLANVPDDKPSYAFSYKLKYDGGEKPGLCDFTVWPAKLDVTATYKNRSGETHPTLKDGDKVPAFVFQVIQDGGKLVSKEHRTSKDGTVSVDLESASAAVLAAVSPWEIVSPTDQKDATRKRTLEVTCKPWKAKIKNIDGGRDPKSPLAQHVNLENGAKQLLKVEVGPEDLSLAKKDQEVKVRVTFPKENGPVEDPFPALWTGTVKATKVAATVTTAKPGTDELKYEHTVKITKDGDPAVFYVQLGVCGGDTCKIEVGVTDDRNDDTLHTINKRKIVLELLVPKPELRQKCSTVLADTGAALADSLLTELKRVYQDMHIDFEFPTNGCVVVEAADFKTYLKGDGVAWPGTGWSTPAIAHPEHMFVDAAKFATWDYNETTKAWSKKTWASGKLFLMSDYQRRQLRDSKLSTVVKTKNTMSWVWCDYISDRSSQEASPGPPRFESDMSTITNKVAHYFQAGAAEEDVDITFHVFDYDPIEASGATGVKSVRWRITHYKKKGAPTFTAVGPTTPGAAYRNWQAVPAFTSLVEAEKWVQITNAITLKMKLPKDTPTSPGNLLTIKRQEPKNPPPGDEEVEYEMVVQVEAQLYGVDFNALGGAAAGQGQMRTSGGLRSMQGTAKTLAHEIGHNLGHGYSAKAPPDTGGRTTATVGLPFGTKVPDGHYYVGHGHTGCHCAKQLIDVLASEGATAQEKIDACAGSFSQPVGDLKTKFFDKLDDSKHCVIWGSGPESPSHTRDYCDDCKKYIRCTDCSDVTKAW